MTPALREALVTILRGFEEGIFVRNTADDEPTTAWAIKVFPYLRALADVQIAIRDDDEEKT